MIGKKVCRQCTAIVILLKTDYPTTALTVKVGSKDILTESLITKGVCQIMLKANH